MKLTILCFFLSIFITFKYLFYVELSIKLSCVIGITILLSSAYKVLCIFLSFFRTEKNLIQRYGKNSWVLISGGAQGIGYEFAVEFAKRGFNIFILDNDAQLLPKSIQNIKQLTNSSVEVRSLVVDFNNSYEQDFYDNIMKQLQNLDISVLINNVGLLQMQEFTKISDEDLKSLIMVNILPQVMLTKKILPSMKLRSKNQKEQKNLKSAIINISSIHAGSPYPYMQVYAATKTFNDFFSTGIAWEDNDDIDIVSFKPGGAFTNQTKQFIGKLNPKMKPNFMILEPNYLVRAFLKDLGYTKSSLGSYKHLICYYLTEVFFQNLIGRNQYAKFFKFVIDQIEKKSKQQQ